MLAHKAVHEVHVAAEVIAGELQGNKELASAAVNASVAYTDPDVAWVGLTETEAKTQGLKVKEDCSPEPLPALPLPMAATKALPNCCLMTVPRRMAKARF
jgi:pyruvate/2-oxoglutarate dehydrogenase complex dihydrolipoamide dehydrogenase (E3) component